MSELTPSGGRDGQKIVEAREGLKRRRPQNWSNTELMRSGWTITVALLARTSPPKCGRKDFGQKNET